MLVLYRPFEDASEIQGTSETVSKASASKSANEARPGNPTSGITQQFLFAEVMQVKPSWQKRDRRAD